ncbi:LPXTG cell wall anchor domain-containing protein [Embleya sp. NPDC059259]|uniref:LPXTG cell wall anchor domain-containing protein n=1 Tax=unclassified Embleya TaxID=2699296 RepID=UPI003681461D
MHTSHRLRRAAGSAAVLGLAAAGVLGAAAGASAAPADTRAESPATPTATASRNTALAPAGDEITVVGRGFTPGARVTVALYAGDTVDRAGSRTLAADGQGVVATPLRVGTGFAPDAPAFEVRVGVDGGPTAKVAVTFVAPAPGGTPRSLRAAAPAASAQLGQAAPQAAAGGAKLTVTPSTGLDPAGASITVSGSGYAAGSGNGIYVVFGPKEADWTTNAGNYGASKWLKAFGPGGINPDGTFSATLTDVKATYKNGAGKDVDCLKTECYVLTMAAHGSPDRSQDAFVKVSFKGGSGTTGSGTTGGSAGTTGGTSGAGTTGAATTGGGSTGGTAAGTSGTSGGTAGKSGGGSLPLTGPAGLVGASVLGVTLVGAGTAAVLTTRRRRNNTP